MGGDKAQNIVLRLAPTAQSGVALRMALGGKIKETADLERDMEKTYEMQIKEKQ